MIITNDDIQHHIIIIIIVTGYCYKRLFSILYEVHVYDHHRSYSYSYIYMLNKLTTRMMNK
jgi:hypothetical protein